MIIIDTFFTWGGTTVNIFLYLIAFVCFAIPGYNWFATGHLSGTFSIVFGILMLYWVHRRKKKHAKPELNSSSGNEELDKLNTRVRVGGADTHQAFVQRLRELKEATLWAHADWQKAAQQESLLQSAISDQEEELEALLGTSKKKLVYSVHSLSTTEIDQRFVKSMSWLSSRTVQLADIIDRSLDNIFLAIGL